MIRINEPRPPTFPNRWGSSIDLRSGAQDVPTPDQLPKESRRIPVIRDVLVALDGSAAAEHALPWALRIAEAAHARVRIAHVCPPPAHGFYRPPRTVPRELTFLLNHPTDAYLTDITRRLARAGARSVEPVLLDGPEVSETLAQLSASSDLTVMASRRRNRFVRFFRGSVSRAVLQDTKRPMLIVPGYGFPVDLTGRPSLRHSLVPLDGTPGGEAVLPIVAALSRLMRGRQTLTHVIPEGASALHDPGSRERTYLNLAACSWYGALPKLSTRLIWSDTNVKQEVVQQIREEGADFVALATRPASLGRLIRCGVTDYVLQHASVPVLVVKQPQATLVE